MSRFLDPWSDRIPEPVPTKMMAQPPKSRWSSSRRNWGVRVVLQSTITSTVSKGYSTIFRYIQIFNGLNCWCVWSICVKQRSDHHLKLRVKTSTATVLLSLNSIVTQSYSSAYPSSWYLDILISWYLEILWFWYHFGLILVSFRTCWYLSHPSWIRFLRSVSWAPRACWAPWAPRWPWSGRFHVAAGDAATRPQHVRNP